MKGTGEVMSSNDVSNCLRLYRKEKHLTQEEIAKKANCRRLVISRIEQGKSIPSLKVALRLSEILGMTVNDLFFFDQFPTSISKKNTTPQKKKVESKRKKLLKEISSLTYDKSWKENPKTVELVKKKRKELDQLTAVKKRATCNEKKVKIKFLDGKSKEYETLAEACHYEHISIHTIHRHLKDGKPDKFGRMYERVGK